MTVELHGDLLWVRSGKRLRPADPEAYQRWLKRWEAVEELERLREIPSPD